jgi:hypothetical protein
MRRLDDHEIDPEIAAQLDAIDATLAGDPVDPEHAELAELALLVAAEKPELDPGFARNLDRRVAARFASAPGAQPAGRRGWQWLWKPMTATLAAGLAAVLVVVGLNSLPGGGGSSSSSSSASVAASAATTASAGSSAGSGTFREKAAAPAASASAAAGTSSTASGGTSSALSGGTSSAPSGGTSSAASSGTPSPQPPSNGRKVIQSANLALTSAPNRVEDVAQEVFDVVGRENGIVNRSTVTATGGTDGYAQFQLRIPSSSLADTMNALSHLRYAHVGSRTDNTQDINDKYVSINHRLADARALRTALLKQLAAATTQQQIDSLNARIHDAEASIASDEATIRTLNRQIDFSQVSVSINAAASPFVPPHHSGFTIGKAAHDAGRVLTVAAGVALISLAVLLPVALVAALIWWIAAAIRHRRREQALDAA